MRFLFVDCRDRRLLLNTVATELRSKGHTVNAIVAQGIDASITSAYDNVYILDDYSINFEWNKVNDFSQPDLEWVAPVLDRIYRLNLNIDTATLPAKILGCHWRLKEIFTAFQPDCVFCEAEADPISMSAVRISQERGIKFYTLLVISLLPGKILLMPCSFLDSAETLEMRVVRNRNRKNVKNSLRTTASSCVERNVSYHKHGSWPQFQRNWMLALVELFLRVAQLHFVLPFKKNKQYDLFLGDINVLSVKALIYRLRRNLRLPFIQLLSIYSKKFIRKDIPIVEVAMQYRPEASTSVIGLDYFDFDRLVQYAVENYPNYQLVLKDHPLVYGYNKLSFYFKHILVNKRPLRIKVEEASPPQAVVLNTSTYGMDSLRNGIKDVDILGNVSFKIINTSHLKPKISIMEFEMSYLEFCIEDTEHVYENIAKKLLSSSVD